MTERGWWYRATTEQRLAQIDAGIELGMTIKQIAMNCGCMYSLAGRDDGTLIGHFAVRHGRFFPSKNNDANRNMKLSMQQLKPRRLSEAKAAYMAGESVDFWRVE